MKSGNLRSFWLVLVSMALTSPSLAAGALNPEAQKHFDAGLAYAEDPAGAKWEEALKEFRAAYAASPNWKLMNNIGLCALHLERDGEAIEAYKLYLANGGESDFTHNQRAQMERDIAMLSATLVKVSIDVEPRDALIIDERRNTKGELLVNQYPIRGGRIALGIHPGLHKVTVQAPGFVSAEWTFNAEPASEHQHRVELQPLDKPSVVAPAPAPAADPVASPPTSVPDRTPTAVYVGLAATGVFAVAATVTGVVTMGKANEFDNSSDRDERHRIAESGKTFSLLTDIGIGAALLSAGATAYFYFTAPKSRTESVANQSRFSLSPMASPSAAGLHVTGKF